MMPSLGLRADIVNLHVRASISSGMVIVQFTDGTFDVVASVENPAQGLRVTRIFPHESNQTHLAKATDWQLACLGGVPA
jgi:hypothetical protein